MTHLRTMLLAALLTSSPISGASVTIVSDAAFPPAAGSGEPFLSTSRNGLLLSWLEPVAGTKETALRFTTYRDGHWSAAQNVVQRSELIVNWADFPSIVEDLDGTLFAHWLQKHGNSTYASDVMTATSKDKGRTWSKGRPLHRDGRKVEHGFVTLSPLPGGGVGATWLDGRNMVEGKEEGDMTLRYATISAAGEIASEVQLDDRTCECCTTGMTIVGGRPLIVYRDRSGDETRDIAVVRKMERGWSKPRVLHADSWKITGCPVNGPQTDARGRNVAVAWFTGAADHGRVLVAFSTDAGATFEEPASVDDGVPAGRVDIVMTDANTAVVSWSEQVKGGAELRVRQLGRNRRRGPAVKVADASASRAAGFARMASVGDDVYIAWTEPAETGKRVRVARVRF